MTIAVIILGGMVGFLIILGVGLSVRMMRMEQELECAHDAAHLTLDALTAHLNGHDVTIESLTEDGTPIRETDIEE